MLVLKTKDELIGFLLQYKSVANATIVSRTQVKMNKKDVATKTQQNPRSEAWKVSLFNAEINSSYEDKVNDKRLLEGVQPTFEAKASKWGETASKSLDTLDGQYYLKVIPGKNISESTYEDSDGNKIDYKELAPYIPSRPVKTASEHQGLEEAVQFRKYKIDSIAYFSIPGIVEYTA